MTCPDVAGCLVLGRHSPSWLGVVGWVAGNRFALGRVCMYLADIQSVGTPRWPLHYKYEGSVGHRAPVPSKAAVGNSETNARGRVPGMERAGHSGLWAAPYQPLP